MVDLPSPSISIAGLAPDPVAPWASGTPRVDPRAAVAWVATLGVRTIALDATLDGIRPRQLDRSARRDLAALLRRRELGLTGLDLWIPPEHLLDPARVQRATDAITDALACAAELAALAGATPSAGGRGPAGIVSVTLPEQLPDTLRGELERAAARAGSLLVDHRVGASASGAIGVGIDPAATLLASADPATHASRAGPGLVCARLSDASTSARVAPGSGGRLDLLAYRVALSTARFGGPVVIDLRGVADQHASARAWIERWSA